MLRREVRLARSNAMQALRTVADLKASQIAAWRQERLDDAAVNSSGVIRRGVIEWQQADVHDAWRADIRETMDLVRLHYGYQNVILSDPSGRILISLDPRLGGGGCPATARMAAMATEARGAIFGEVFRCPHCDAFHLDTAAPIMDEDSHPAAVLILRSDPRTSLFPLVRSQPGSRASAETLLVLAENGEAVLISPSESLAASPMSVRVPIGSGAGPVAESVRERAGFFEGPDHRGTPVLAAFRRVADSPWYVAETIAMDDVLADARRTGRLIGGLTLALVLAAAAGAGLLHKRAGRRLYAALYRSERARREALEEFRITLYSIGDGVMVSDAQGRVLRMNVVAEQLTGWREIEAKGQPMAEVFRIVNETTRAPVESPVDRVLVEQRIVGLANHTLLVCRDGTERPIADSGAPMYDEDGALIGVVLVFRDRTEERAAQQAIRREHENLEAILAAAPIAMIVLAGNEQIVEANPAAEELFDRSLGLMIHKRCGDFLGCVNRGDHPAGCGRGPACPDCLLFDAVRRVLSDGGPVVGMETEARIESGGTTRAVWFRFSAAAVEMSGERHAVVALHDITEERRMEEQLRQAQKMEAVGRLAGGVAHDFNNMLEVILGHAELALDLLGPGQGPHQDLQEIQKAAYRSAELTRQLLAFARRQTVSPRPLDLNATVTGILNMLRRLIGEQLSLVWQPASDLGTVEMDPAQVNQILANLMVNARDAIEGTGEITIETRNATAGDVEMEPQITSDAYVLLVVRDDGRGMEPQVLEHIFEPFFTTKGVGEGTGLGLATVYGIVRQNHGFIRVRSQPGEGTEFTLFLPRRERPPETESVAKEEEPGHGSETVLLVDDEEAILKLGRRTLERYGYRVLAARSPDEALSLLETHAGRVDLLLTDLVMPGMNGRDLSRTVAARLPGIKILFMSGYTANVIVHQGILEAGLSYLQKPFSTRALAGKVREVLDG